MKTITSKLFAVSALVFGLGTAQQASAALPISFAFDPFGMGSTTISNLTTIDQFPGNALAVGGITAVQNWIAGSGSTEFTLAYQANLNSMNVGELPIFTNGTGGNFFNFTMQFQERVAGVAQPTPGVFAADFAFAPGGTNLFQMFSHTTLADSLTGAGFGAGTSILSATVSEVRSSNYTNHGGSVPLDGFGADNWTGQQSVIGSGSTALILAVTSAHSGYFPTLTPGDKLISFFNTSQVTPFNQVNPSQNFPWLNSGVGHTSSLGAINGGLGGGPDFLFQADANQSFAIPEPTALFLFGIGLAGLIGLRKRG